MHDMSTTRSVSPQPETPVPLNQLRRSLHLSSSQISQYLLCSQRYRYQQVQGLLPTHTSINLLFGRALHSALEACYSLIQLRGEPLPLDALQQLFVTGLNQHIDDSAVPILYNKLLPDLLACESQGCAMLEPFHQHLQAQDFSTIRIEGIELPLIAPLFDAGGKPTDFQLVGVIDLLLRDTRTNTLIAVDHKTSKSAYGNSQCDDSIQMSLYACLLHENGYLGANETFHGRFDVLRKLKTPSFEQIELTRTPDQIEAFLTLARGVVHAIDCQVYLPVYGWACNDCGYRERCRGR
ncbi:MAG: PD-(D/E)XK nuclease family protein [Desulfuromonadaceae bacterium]|nr:PD-(D/E)XK nuclease family protein [Desulfuromonadaceae bacterium]